MQASSAQAALASLLCVVLGAPLTAQFVHNVQAFGNTPGIRHAFAHGNTVLGYVFSGGSGNTYTWDGDNLTWTNTGASSLSYGSAIFVTRNGTAAHWDGSQLHHWSGSAWNTVTTTGTPPPAVNGNFAFATLPNGELLVFGGWDSSNQVFVNTTHRLSTGNVWSLLSPANAPSARENASMTHDGNGNYVLFGGDNNSGYLGDTWQFNGTNWTQLSPVTSPGVRRLAAMCFRPRINAIVMFGGDNNGTARSDYWVLSGSTWTQQTISSWTPSTNSGFHHAAIDLPKDEIVAAEFLGGLTAIGIISGDRPYGNGCVCGGQTNAMAIDSTGSILNGSTFTISFSNCEQGNALWLAFSAAEEPSPSQILGLPTGCVNNIAASGSGAVLVTASVSGTPTFNVDLPDNTSTIGLRVFYQGVQLNLSTFTGCSSNGLEIQVGRF